MHHLPGYSVQRRRRSSVRSLEFEVAQNDSKDSPEVQGSDSDLLEVQILG
jgi:hypothetical protein